jgi:general secretion pathway protein G
MDQPIVSYGLDDERLPERLGAAAVLWRSGAGRANQSGKRNQMNLRQTILRAAAKKSRARGMTLIEIMVVLVILGLIAGAIGFNVFSQLKAAQVKSADLDLKAISNGIDLYHVETGQWPEALQQLVPKYVKEVHKDPWGSDYSYVRTGDGFSVYSYGPDKAQGGGDDITVQGGEAAGNASAGTPR